MNGLRLRVGCISGKPDSGECPVAKFPDNLVSPIMEQVGSVTNGLEMPEAERNSILFSSSGLSEDRDGGEGGGVSLFAEDDDEELGVDALADEKAIAAEVITCKR